MKKILAVLAIIGSLVIISLYRSYASALQFKKNPNSTQRIILDVPKGSSAQQIASLLKQKGLIESEWAFKLFLKQNNLSDKLQAGRMVVQEDFDMQELIDALQSGKTTEVSVTLLEGWSNRQIAEALEEKAITTADEFMECLKTCEFEEGLFPYGYQEGYLYPDTYFVDPNQYSNQAFISRLARTLQQKLTEEDKANIKKVRTASKKS
ncbi:endolytic transglycosylase MltG [Candidatus Peregrinibacteria bacterium]|nr:MAG: endolytic transglycosylase MltG [Candidatus Peregrinibacteria bacterium]